MALPASRPFHNAYLSGSRLDPWFTGLAFFVPLLLSLSHLSAVGTFPDQAETYLGIKTLGIIHFPGFPGYLLAQKLLLWLTPAADELWKMTLNSLVFAGLAAAFFYRTGRLLRFPPLVCLIASLMLFFSPGIWPAVLKLGPEGFQLLTVVVSVYLTLRLIQAQGRFPNELAILIWAAALGFSSVQPLALFPWIAATLALGLILGLPRRRSGKSAILIVLSGWLVGWCLPYLVVFARVSAASAYVDPDALFPFPQLRQGFAFFPWLAWLFSYWLRGLGAYSSTLNLCVWWSWIKDLGSAFQRISIFPLAVILMGIFLNLKEIFFRPPIRASDDVDPMSRLASGLLPLMVLGVSFALAPVKTIENQISFSLVFGYLSLISLHYCYSRLGHSDELSSKLQRPRPHWFGVGILLLMPIFMMISGEQRLGSVQRTDQSAQKRWGQVKDLLASFPQHTLLVASDARTAGVIEALQTHEPVRMDIEVVPLTSLWPGSRWATRSAPLAPDLDLERSLVPYRSLISSWEQGLSNKLAQQRPAFLISGEGPIQPVYRHFLHTFEVEPAALVVPALTEFLQVHRILGPVQPVLGSRYEPAEHSVVTFRRSLRLTLAWPDRKAWPLGEVPLILRFPAAWQTLQAQEASRLQLEVRLVPKTPSPGGCAPAREVRERWPLVRTAMNPNLRSGQRWNDLYQLALPLRLRQGSWGCWVGLWDEREGRYWPAEAGRGTDRLGFAEVGVLETGTP